jgi:protein-tyrosine-phosphatase
MPRNLSAVVRYDSPGRDSGLVVWGLALGYFAFYAPYSAAVKSVSTGLVPGISQAFSPLALLPGVLLATVLVVVAYITLLGWWRYVPVRKVLGVRLPWPRPLLILSGLGTAAIIVTTTLAYTFHGISIVFALLLMRGGVLIMAPFVDAAFRCRVAWNSWAGLALSLLAVSVALADQDGYELSLAAVANLVVYYLGYIVRLQCITASEKRGHPTGRRGYFAEEQTCSMLALLIAGIGLLWYGADSAAAAAAIVTPFWGDPLAGPAMLIGVLYACLFLFGSLIYMQLRENCFCIPVNRCSSVLAGVAASVALFILFDQETLRPSHLTGTAIIIIAILVLALPSILAAQRAAAGRQPAVQRLILFVCDGNTSRSPMAEAICRSELARWLGSLSDRGNVAIRVESAGLSAESGRSMSRKAELALSALEVPAHDHAARALSDELVGEADAIFCMTGQHRADLLAGFPAAGPKTFCLDTMGDVGNPAGAPLEAFIGCAQQIRAALLRQLEQHELFAQTLAAAE